MSVWDARCVAVVTHMPVEAPEQMHPARSMVVDATIAFPMTGEDTGYSRFFRDQYPRVVRTINLVLRGDVLSFDVISHAAGPSDMVPQTSIFETLPFTRVP